ncbi:Apoptosis-inducing factor 3 [Manis javanica]|nr:Apoptosis-inducing factor 3 [Manis javanica]
MRSTVAVPVLRIEWVYARSQPRPARRRADRQQEIPPMIEKSLWHPVAQAHEVVDAPLGVQLLDQPLVLWRDPQGLVRVFVDRCPHRGARLSMGRVENGHLECPYHGWQFADSGQCVKVPALPSFTPRPRSRQPQSNLHSTSAAEVEYTYEVTAPYAAVLTKLPESGTTRAGWRESIALFICPVTPETSRVWFRLAVADFDSPDAQLQEFQHTIFCQDQPVLESQQPKCLPLDPRAEMHSAADRMSSAYRRYLRASGITFELLMHTVPAVDAAHLPQLLKAMPKAELHMHIEGSLEPN